MTKNVEMQQLRSARAALCTLAMREGANEAQIREGIRLAMLFAMCSPDPAARRFWQTLPHAEANPTPEELIAYLAQQLKRHIA